MVKVRALKPGFIGGTRRRAGAVFEVPEGVTASWFEPVAANAATNPKPEKPAKKADSLV